MAHWGLLHWMAGINEYVIDRCLCCGMYNFDPIDIDRAYWNTEFTSDCCCVYKGCCDNPITGTICLPFMIITHLLTLPFACCSNERGMYYGKISDEEKKLEEEEKKLEEEKRSAEEKQIWNEKWAALSPEEKNKFTWDPYEHKRNYEEYLNEMRRIYNRHGIYAYIV